MSVVKSPNSSINSNQHHCVSHWRKCVSQALPARTETKVLEGDEALRVKRECKATWVYPEDTVSKALWEIKGQKEKRVKRVKRVNHCKRQSWNRKLYLQSREFVAMICQGTFRIIGIVYSSIYSSIILIQSSVRFFFPGFHVLRFTCSHHRSLAISPAEYRNMYL